MENARTTPRAATAGEKSQQAGFTLLELLVSVAIFVVVTGSIYSPWR
jgi:prepilin-type N-terminal cleavage/methylation domain-containing protein